MGQLQAQLRGREMEIRGKDWFVEKGRFRGCREGECLYRFNSNGFSKRALPYTEDKAHRAFR